METSTLLEDAEQSYTKSLLASGQAMNYMLERGFGGAIAARYRVGFAAADSSTLRPVVKRWGIQACQDAGLHIKANAKRPFEMFRGRLIFPIRDAAGVLVGFGGRHLRPDEHQPKYLNSPESRLFAKATLLYGQPEASGLIAAQKRVFVTEGYFDVLRLAGADYPAVAAMGTAVTAHHIELLLGTADQVNFCFDGDGGGVKAADQALQQMVGLADDASRVNFIFLPDGHDPDSFVKSHGAEAFASLAEKPVSLVEYLTSTLLQGCELQFAEGRARCAAKGREFWRIASPSMQGVLVDFCSDVVRLSPDDILEIWSAQKT